MKKLLILTRFPPEYEPQRLAEEARKRGIKPEIINYQTIQVGPGKLDDFDFVIPRSAAHRQKKSLLNQKIALIKSLPKKTICLNKTTYLRLPKLGKIRQAEILEKNGLPTIPTLKRPTFPAILKAEFGSHSRRVIRVENEEQASKVMQTYAGRWIYQPLIKSPIYWRVIVLGGESLGVMERKTSRKFVKSGEARKEVSSYIRLGGVNREEIENLAIKATQVFQAEFTGVDLLVDKEKLMIIEVNRSPQFQIFERMTKVDVAEKIISFLTSASE